MEGADDDFFDEPPEAVAPTVVAVVVSRDPGPWFEETLTALAAQDYPHLSLLVIDTGTIDITPRVATAAPNAYVRRVAGDPGFSAAANEVVAVVEGASHFVFCHDDVAPDPDAIRLLLEEAFRSNAAIVGPKLVDWDDPTRLLQVGLAADKGGVTVGPVERRELDQEQHDAVRDVFALPGALTLVRADLFTMIGGFDPAIPLMGEDLDLCWRAQIAGGRVLVAPAARVRHREALTRGERPGQAESRVELRALELRHRLRSVLKNYGRFHLIRVLPQLMVLGVIEAVYLTVVGRRRAARAIVRAWTSNLRSLGTIRAARRAVRGYRVWPDSEVRRLQARGNARLTRFLRGQLGRGDRARLLGDRDWGRSWRDARLAVAVWSVVALVLLIGSRTLLSDRIPAVGEFAPLRGPVRLFELYLSGWRASGLGSAAPAPPAFALLGVASTVLLGAVGILQKLLVVGALPLGLIGAYRLARPLASAPARLLVVVVYASIPVPYNAIARGRLGGVIAYALAPWILGALARATATAPFAEDADDARWRLRVVAVAVAVAVASALAPSIAVVLLVAAAGLAVASVAVDGGGARALALAAWATAGAAALLVPWSLDLVLPGGGVERLTGVGVASDRAPGFGELLRFHTGPLGDGPIGWVFLVAAGLPLIVGHGWRLAWAARCWGVALATWGFAWSAGRGWLPIPAPSPEVSLAPAAAAIALAAGLGLVAFRTDLPAYRFGWRQFASSSAALAVALGTLPVLAATIDGRWHLPGRDYRAQFSWMPDQRDAGAFRVLWLGDPEALPLQGWDLVDGVAYATSDEGVPDVTDLWPGSDGGATGLIAEALELATGRVTTRLGADLAPMAIRYIVVIDRAAPTPDAPRLGRLPTSVVDGLASQLDLKLISTDNDQRVYENAAWGPGRSRLARDRENPERVRKEDIAVGVPALRRRHSAVHFSGRVEAGDTVYFSEAASSGWRLTSGGESATRQRALGWANAFTVERGGKATLEYERSWGRILFVGLQIALWAVAIRYLVVHRRAGAVT